MAKFSSDYLKIYEKRLNEDYNKFKESCDNFSGKLDSVKNNIQHDFNDSDCGITTTINDCGMKKNCKIILKEMANMIKFREKLKDDLKKEKLVENNPQKADAKLLGLPIIFQNELLIQRVMNMQYSKLLARKAVKELHNEFESYQKRESEALIESKIQENLVHTLILQQKSLEIEVNSEVERVKKNYAKIYFDKLKIKNKYDNIYSKLNQEMTHLLNLQYSLTSNKNELEKINEEISIEKEKVKEEENLQLQYGELLEFLERDYETKINDISKIEDQIQSIRKTIKKLSEIIEKEKKEANQKILDIQEDNHVYERIKDIYHDDIHDTLHALKINTWDREEKNERIIKELKNKICQVANKICQSNVIIEQLKNDIDHHMQRENKFITGVDYMGGNFIKVNK